MATLAIRESWLSQLLPGGWPLGTSTLITGPGGSGKPLIGSILAAEWLEAGGSVVFLSLQYPTHAFITESLRRTAGLDIESHGGRVAFIQLDAQMHGMEVVAQDHIRANLVQPETWRAALRAALDLVPLGGPGRLLFGSALNLLLFSPTYGVRVLEEMKKALTEGEEGVTSLFSVSSSAKKEMIAELEAVADNLLVARSARSPFRLFLRVQRMKGVPFDGREIDVPFPPEMLEEVKEVADFSRHRIIPTISSI